jgi:hypothetical protein
MIFSLNRFMHEYGDPRIKDYFLMQSPFPSMALSALFVFIVKVNRKRKAQLKGLNQSFLSGSWTTTDGKQKTVQSPQDDHYLQPFPSRFEFQNILRCLHISLADDWRSCIQLALSTDRPIPNWDTHEGKIKEE